MHAGAVHESTGKGMHRAHREGIMDTIKSMASRGPYQEAYVLGTLVPLKFGKL